MRGGPDSRSRSGRGFVGSEFAKGCGKFEGAIEVAEGWAVGISRGERIHVEFERHVAMQWLRAAC